MKRLWRAASGGGGTPLELAGGDARATTMTMKSLQLIEHGAPGRFELVEGGSLHPAASEIKLRVRACGLNHLDLWVEEGKLPVPVHLPRILGSEVAGEIMELGEGVEGWQTGDRVAVQSNLFCGECEFCLAGEESLCVKGGLLGVDREGGFAEELLVPARTLVHLPKEVEYVTAAALTLAGSTAMHMLTRRAKVRPGSWVLVMGASSGVGSAAIQIASALGAKVISTASTAEKRALGLRLGAQAVVDLRGDDWPKDVREVTGKRGVDLIVEHLGGAVLERAFRCLARNGTVVTCGATLGREIQLPLWPLFVKQFSLIGSYGRTRQDMAATLEWAALGKLKPVVDKVCSLAEAPREFQRLRERGVLGKVVIGP